MSKRERRSYDHEFKTMAVELHLSGKTSTAVGKELGIGPDLVRRWSREMKTNGAASFPGNGKQNLSEEQKEIHALRKALKESELEREILKKAVSIFSRGDSKYTNS
ncbi:transposase [Cytophagaceae bacterium ABcell3]|nr:transposase [Cytophagaceae bacterium ABcell3]WMJ71963.1 transposase [Cytophagaceae bacterium ABcell3]WMJ73033.1 transposase [Cytophagaceae bacterium ABcell3]WMJ73246.1 transposase [Cytophagaceae bacterium ABcell3]WMJ73497.1 transposase [Cytophagaceae bacterium ABcell3]